jgi:hypothetical protein
MLDALALPTMGLVIVAFLTYIWVAWLKDKDGRSLTVKDEDEDDDARNRFS